MTEEASFVIAVSGVSGAGKSSVIDQTVELLGDATRLHFDAYDSVSVHPPDLKEWLDRGADVDEWKTPLLASHLRELRAGRAVQFPEGGGTVEPARYILIEEPFGKSRAEMAVLIDLAAHIEVPADVLLARRLLRRLGEELPAHEHDLPGQLQRDLHQYLESGRELSARASLAVSATADIILDGMNPVDELAATLVAEAHRRVETARVDRS